MRQFGLIGYPLGHSFSENYFAKKFEKEQIEDCRYDNFPIDDIEMLPSVIAETEHLRGLNVTIPYKVEVLQFCDELDEEAEAVQAVNTLLLKKSGAIVGYNTDIPGFRDSLLQLLGGNSGMTALILGTGGASKAVRFVLDKMSIPFHLVSRQASKDAYSYDQLAKLDLQDFQLIINTTPLGMAPHLDHCADLNYDQLGKQHYLYDLIYNPSTTLFLEKGRAQGAKTKNGYEMLALQAEASWEIWNREEL